jgi:N,N'-diacetyllegionaminate synthase
MSNKMSKRGIYSGGLAIGPDEPVFIIAEAGVNHNGDLGMALELVDVAAQTGADAVKFQTFKAEHIITRQAPKAQYHIETTGSDEDQSWFELLKTQELTREMHEAIIERCHAHDILFLSTPYDKDSVDLLDELDVALYKVASTDANNIPFLEYIASKGRPMIMSTAMCDLQEVAASVEAIRAAGIDNLVVLQCTGSYPAPAGQANLKAMETITEACGVATGYSDHVPGMAVAIGAIARGAVAYEKHYTLDRSLPGPDHRASLEPEELKALITSIREVESSLGDGTKQVMPCEVENRKKLRKSIIAACSIAPGEVLSPEKLSIKRAGGQGISPDKYHEVIGKRTASKLEPDEPLTLSAIEQ